jgi:predicted DNA-binding transcriptional regulator AlpA
MKNRPRKGPLKTRAFFVSLKELMSMPGDSLCSLHLAKCFLTDLTVCVSAIILKSSGKGNGCPTYQKVYQGDNMNTSKQYLDELEVAQRLGLSFRTLRQWRWLRRGPSFKKFGKSVRYSVEDVAAYEAACSVDLGGGN